MYLFNGDGSMNLLYAHWEYDANDIRRPLNDGYIISVDLDWSDLAGWMSSNYMLEYKSGHHLLDGMFIYGATPEKYYDYTISCLTGCNKWDRSYFKEPTVDSINLMIAAVEAKKALFKRMREAEAFHMPEECMSVSGAYTLADAADIFNPAAFALCTLPAFGALDIWSSRFAVTDLREPWYGYIRNLGMPCAFDEVDADGRRQRAYTFMDYFRAFWQGRYRVLNAQTFLIHYGLACGIAILNAQLAESLAEGNFNAGTSRIEDVISPCCFTDVFNKLVEAEAMADPFRSAGASFCVFKPVSNEAEKLPLLSKVLDLCEDVLPLSLTAYNDAEVRNLFYGLINIFPDLRVYYEIDESVELDCGMWYANDLRLNQDCSALVPTWSTKE